MPQSHSPYNTPFALNVPLTQKLLIDGDPVDPLLGKLKRGKENSIYNARTTHGDAETCVHCQFIRLPRTNLSSLTAIHPRAGELDLGSTGLLPPADEAVALVDALRSVNREDLYSH